VGQAYPLRFRSRRLPPGSTLVSAYRPYHRFRGFRPAAAPNRMVLTTDYRGLAGMAGFRRGAVSSHLRSGVNRTGWFDLTWPLCISASRPGELFRRMAFAFPLAEHSALRPSRVVRTVGPVFRGGFRFHFRRIASNPSERQNRSSGWDHTAPHALAGKRRSRRLSACLQSDLAPFRIPGRWSLSEPPAGPSKGSFRPSSTHGVGCPISPTSRSELASR